MVLVFEITDFFKQNKEDVNIERSSSNILLFVFALIKVVKFLDKFQQLKYCFTVFYFEFNFDIT